MKTEGNVATVASSVAASIAISGSSSSGGVEVGGNGGDSDAVTPVTMTGIAENKMAEYDSSTTFSDTISSASSTTSSSSDLDDLSEYLAEETTSSATTTPSHPDAPNTGQRNNPGRNDISPTAFEGESLCVGNLAVPATNGATATRTATATAACSVPASPGQGQSCSILTVAKDGVVCDADSSPFSSDGAGHRLPPLNEFEERPRIAAADNAASRPSPSAPGVTAICGVEGHDRREGVMSQEEVLPLFTPSATGGVVNSEDDLWGMTNDEAEALFCRPPLGRLTSSSWGLDSVHAATVVANDNDDTVNVDSTSVDTGGLGQEADCVDKSSVAPAPEVAADEQQQQLPGGVEMPPVGSQILFGWCEEVRIFASGHDHFPLVVLAVYVV